MLACLAAGPLCLTGTPAVAQPYLSGGEVVAIASGSALTGYAGARLRHVDSGRTSLLGGPGPVDRWVQRILAGSTPKPGQTNFLDNTFGSVITPAVGTGVLVFADLQWPRGESGKDMLQDVFLMVAGLVANKGVNDAVKGLVARPRPYTLVEQGLDVHRPQSGYSYDHNSFYSGHASSSFYTATFVDKRLLSIMRVRMSASQYDAWKWLPTTLLYGWASFVGLSRVQALKHNFSDVVVGSVAGWLMAELFYQFGDGTPSDGTPAAPAMVSFTFDF